MSIIYGSPLFLSSSSQNADLPPLLDNFKAYAGTTPPEPETITLADIPVSDAETETIVNLRESDGQLHPYLYLVKDYEGSKAGLLLRKDISQLGNIDNLSGNKYQGNSLDTWCTNTFINNLDQTVQNALVAVDIASTSGTKINRKCFAISDSEYGGNHLIEGNNIPYFDSNSKRIAMYNNNAYDHWTRSSFPSAGSTAYFIQETGEISSNISTQKGYRPAICLTLLFKIKATPNIDGSYDMYEGQAVQTLAETDGMITIAADKMEESRAKELAGAVWVYGDHIPKNVNDGTKIQLTREEITRPDGEPYITLNDILASDAEIETIINIKESDGELHPYLYLSNDYLGSGAGLLLRKDCYQKGVWHVTGAIEVFNGSQFDVWCSNTFPTLLDTSISNILMEVDLPTKTTGAIRRKCFTLSNTEYGGSMYPAEGTALPYFKDNVRRQSMFNGGTVDYWTRSKYDVSQAYFIGLTGGFGQDKQILSLGYRPAFCLPLTFKLKATPNENGSYDMYDEVSSISTFASSEFIVEKSVSWEQTKDFYARQFTYNSKKQYQTMIEGAIATPNDIPEGQPITELESGSKVKLGVWNDIPLQWKVARDTSDQSIRLVLEPTSVSLLGNMQYDEREPSNSDSNRRVYGNNRYIYSNIHQWLNATKVSGWYTAQHSADVAPSYVSSSGFLSGWSENHIAALDRATLTTSRTSIDGGGTETFVARVALISTAELGLQSSTGGGRLDIFNADGDRATGTVYWTRTPDSSRPYDAYQVTASGGLYEYYVYVAYGVRPLCTPKSTTYVSLEPDDDGCYTIMGVMK